MKTTISNVEQPKVIIQPSNNEPYKWWNGPIKSKKTIEELDCFDNIFIRNLPYRQLRKSVSAFRLGVWSNLPYRQLRKKRCFYIEKIKSNLPYRQLRKYLSFSNFSHFSNFSTFSTFPLPINSYKFVKFYLFFCNTLSLYYLNTMCLCLVF